LAFVFHLLPRVFKILSRIISFGIDEQFARKNKISFVEMENYSKLALKATMNHSNKVKEYDALILSSYPGKNVDAELLRDCYENIKRITPNVAIKFHPKRFD
jgi:hypothetical protein